jgi:hypothetical protein
MLLRRLFPPLVLMVVCLPLCIRVLSRSSGPPPPLAGVMAALAFAARALTVFQATVCQNWETALENYWQDTLGPPSDEAVVLGRVS